MDAGGRMPVAGGRWPVAGDLQGVPSCSLVRPEAAGFETDN